MAINKSTRDNNSKKNNMGKIFLLKIITNISNDNDGKKKTPIAIALGVFF